MSSGNNDPSKLIGVQLKAIWTAGCKKPRTGRRVFLRSVGVSRQEGRICVPYLIIYRVAMDSISWGGPWIWIGLAGKERRLGHGSADDGQHEDLLRLIW